MSKFSISFLVTLSDGQQFIVIENSWARACELARTISARDFNNAAIVAAKSLTIYN